jgi:hypothetical protein
MVKFYKIVAVPLILYDGESWTAKERDWTRRRIIEKIFLRSVKVYSEIDKLE